MFKFIIFEVCDHPSVGARKYTGFRGYPSRNNGFNPYQIMLKLLKRLLVKGPEMPDSSAFKTWALDRGHEWRRERGTGGCVVDGVLGVQAWRLEWGPSQRDYIVGHELRLIAELALPNELMVMVLNRCLMVAMERAVYEQYVDDVQTRMDTNTPPEMRWLVMHAKLAAADLGPVRDRYGAVSSVRAWPQQWLAGSLGDALAATMDVVRSDQPVVLTIGRGRLMLRTKLDKPDMAKLAIWFSVFEHAVRTAAALRNQWREAAGVGTATQPGARSHSERVRAVNPATTA